MENTTKFIRRAVRTFIENTTGLDRQSIPEEAHEDTISIGTDSHVIVIARGVCASGSTSGFTSLAPTALLVHAHIVAASPIIFRVTEKTGGGEIDFDGDMLLLSSGSATLGVNVSAITLVNATGAAIPYWGIAVTKV